jgi:mannose-6-phosphate isomerase-like protein (cupin superfamily)
MAEDNYYVFGPGEGHRQEARGSVMHFKARSATTNGRFSLMERTLPPGGRMPPPHLHVDCEEAYYVLNGAVTFVLGGTERTEGPETFLLVPGGTAHTFGNRSGEPARLLVLHSPALDGYFADLDALWSGSVPPTPEEERALMSRHGMQPATT